METWLLVAVLAGAASQIFNFLNRYILKDGGDSVSFGWFTEFLRFFIYLLFLPVDMHFENSSLTYILLFSLGIVNILSVYVFFKMHSIAQLSISSIISRTRLVWVPVISFIFLGEILKVNQYIGIAIIFLGLSLTVSPRKFFADKGVFYSLLTSFVVAVISVLMKALTPHASTSIIMMCMALPTTILFPIVMKNSIHRLRQEFRQKLLLKLVASGSNLLAMYLTLLALQSGGPVSIVSGIYQAMMILSVIAGIVILKERNDVGRKIAGSIITILGILFITTL